MFEMLVKKKKKKLSNKNFNNKKYQLEAEEKYRLGEN